MLLGCEGLELEKQRGGDFLPFGGDQKPRARSALLIQDESCGEFGYGDTGGAVAGDFRPEFQQGVNNPRV